MQTLVRRHFIALGAAASVGTASWHSAFAETPAKFGAAAIPDEARSVPGFAVVADRRVFAVLAFISAMRFEDETDGKEMHPVRTLVRERLTVARAQQPDRFKVWQAIYDQYGPQTFVLMDFALTLSPDYPFECIRRDDEMSYREAAPTLRQLVGILNDLWVTAKLADVWAEVRPYYLTEIRAYDLTAAKRRIDAVWPYLRMPRQGGFDIVAVPNLLDRRYRAIGAKYGDAYYIVESPGASTRTVNLHEYLHHPLNPLVARQVETFGSVLRPYFEAGKSGSYAKSYQELTIFVCECFVRAVDARLTELETPDRTKRQEIVERIVDQANAGGLTLTRPIYDLLPGFEASRKPLDVYAPELFRRLPAKV